MVEHLSDAEFDDFQKLLFRIAGITLSSAKKALVVGRLQKRLQHHGLPTFGTYYELLSRPEHRAELQIAVDLLTTNETSFFREPKHFAFLRDNVLRVVPRGRGIRVWSAASSSGEEPYSIAMTLADNLSEAPWEVLGSDLSTRVLARARSGHYALERSEQIPPALLKKYCLKGVGASAGTFLIDRLVRQRVTFRQINLNAPLPDVGIFDVIFLRNVMIYFDLNTKQQVVARLLEKLRPGGYFFVGHSESLNGVSDAVASIAPAIYRKPE